jgi:2-C-methyl-D-erythritol 4-phosphate cytidylyltransferase/2-C-methyl-D-erythritol 2,4-cyclodiphosphate synthase
LFLDRLISRFLGDIESVKGVVSAVPSGYMNDCFLSNSDKKIDGKFSKFVCGGENRQNSVFNCLEEISKTAKLGDYVLIHDAARPYVSKDLIERVISKLKSGEKAVVPAVYSIDSVRIDNAPVDRKIVNFIQTPQGFVFDLIYELHKKYRNKNMSDDASLCDLDDVPVTLVNGDVLNKKITYESDLVGQQCNRTGFGFDSHEFSNNPSRNLKLCGVNFPNIPSLKAISDGDVAVHSLIDSILGAMGKGSIGEYFPENAEPSRNADSIVFLDNMRTLLLKNNYVISNIDITIVCDFPKIVEYKEVMKANIAAALCIEESKINIKGKTTEGTNITGIASLASILLFKVLWAPHGE